MIERLSANQKRERPWLFGGKIFKFTFTLFKVKVFSAKLKLFLDKVLSLIVTSEFERQQKKLFENVYNFQMNVNFFCGPSVVFGVLKE